MKPSELVLYVAFVASVLVSFSSSSASSGYWSFKEVKIPGKCTTERGTLIDVCTFFQHCPIEPLEMCLCTKARASKDECAYPRQLFDSIKNILIIKQSDRKFAQLYRAAHVFRTQYAGSTLYAPSVEEYFAEEHNRKLKPSWKPAPKTVQNADELKNDGDFDYMSNDSGDIAMRWDATVELLFERNFVPDFEAFEAREYTEEEVRRTLKIPRSLDDHEGSWIDRLVKEEVEKRRLALAEADESSSSEEYDDIFGAEGEITDVVITASSSDPSSIGWPALILISVALIVQAAMLGYLCSKCHLRRNLNTAGNMYMCHSKIPRMSQDEFLIKGATYGYSEDV